MLSYSRMSICPKCLIMNCLFFQLEEHTMQLNHKQRNVNNTQCTLCTRNGNQGYKLKKEKTKKYYNINETEHETQTVI